MYNIAVTFPIIYLIRNTEMSEAGLWGAAAVLPPRGCLLRGSCEAEMHTASESRGAARRLFATRRSPY